MKTDATVLLFTVALRFASPASAFGAGPANRPAVRGDLRRSWFHPSFQKGKLQIAWQEELWRQLTFPRVEA